MLLEWSENESLRILGLKGVLLGCEVIFQLSQPDRPWSTLSSPNRRRRLSLKRGVQLVWHLKQEGWAWEGDIRRIQLSLGVGG